MKHLCHLGLAALFCFGVPAAADDNIAACEIVIQQPILSTDDADSEKSTEDTGDAPMIATFVPAEDFMFSIFDEEPGHITEVEGQPIQAIMCVRKYMIPTEFDMRMIETGIPLYLSQNFDSADSDLMAVFLKDDEFQYQYSGKELSKDNREILEMRMKKLNKKRDSKPAEKEKEE